MIRFKNNISKILIKVRLCYGKLYKTIHIKFYFMKK